MIFVKDRLLYKGNCFNNCFAILTRASFCSFVRRWGIHLALILLIVESRLRIVWAAPTEIPMHLAICLSVNLESVATKFFTFSTIFCEAVFGRRAWGACFTESTPLLNFLHYRVTDEKESFFPINTTYFIKYLFHLYTKNTAVLDIGPYLVSERRPFPNHFSFSVHSVNQAIIKARLNGFTHVLYQWRAYITIYTIHVPISCKSWLKARYWPSCTHIWTPLVYGFPALFGALYLG